MATFSTHLLNSLDGTHLANVNVELVEISYNGRGRYPTKSSMTLAIEIVRTRINQESPQGIVIHNIQLVTDRSKKT